MKALKKKRLIGVLLIIVALIIMTLPVKEAEAQTSASDFLIDGRELIKYRGDEELVTIPDTVESIGQSAFENNLTVKKVVLSNQVRKIGAYAFWGCDHLETVSLGSGIRTIDDFAFAGCKGLKSMTLGSGVSAIGMQAFGDCTGLEEIVIPPETVFIHDSAFDGCARLRIKCEPGSVASAFAEKLALKQSEMAEYEDVPSYGDDSQITPENDVGSDRYLSGNASELSSSKVVGNHAVIFWDAAGLEVMEPEYLKEDFADLQAADQKLTIVDNRIVADHAYYKRVFSNPIALPESILEIGEFAFARSNLKEIHLPEGVQSIGYGAFYHCDELGKVELPNTLIKVEPKAFEYTSWVAEFMNSGSDFLISGGVLVAYGGSDAEVLIPEGVRVIASGVFSGHREIKQVSLPSSLLYIGEEAFLGCTSLKKIIWQEGLTRIEDRAFMGCNSLEDIRLPESLTEIGLQAFGDIPVVYSGGIPEQTYENTAMRLSNASLRGIQETTKYELKLNLVPFENVRLEGVRGEYSFSVEELDAEAFSAAFLRLLGRTAPDQLMAYQLKLTDGSGIPITKLGRNTLQFIVPLPEEYSGYEVRAVQLDRNGQLQSPEAERVSFEEGDALLIRLQYVSNLGIYPTGQKMQEESIQVIGRQLSAKPSRELSEGYPMSVFRLCLGFVMLCGGIYLCLARDRRGKTKI